MPHNYSWLAAAASNDFSVNPFDGPVFQAIASSAARGTLCFGQSTNDDRCTAISSHHSLFISFWFPRNPAPNCHEITGRLINFDVTTLEGSRTNDGSTSVITSHNAQSQFDVDVSLFFCSFHQERNSTTRCHLIFDLCQLSSSCLWFSC